MGNRRIAASMNCWLGRRATMVRLLLIETFAWRPGRRELVALAFGIAALVALGFYIGLH